MVSNTVDEMHMFCIDCKTILEVPDYFAQKALKRCPECNKKYRRAYNAELARENRRKARELREAEKTELDLLREKIKLLEIEIKNLTYLVKAQNEQIELLCCPDPATCAEDIIERRRKKNLIEVT